MFSALSFRKKIILSQIVLFVLFFAILFPFVEKMSTSLVRDSLIESTTELKTELLKATSEREMEQLANAQEFYSFYRISLLDESGNVIFDTQSQRDASSADEVKQALEKGMGYFVGSKFVYVAERFIFQGRTYILRTSVPLGQIRELAETFEIWTLLFAFTILLFFNALVWILFTRLTRPIRFIITAIRKTNVEEGALPDIDLGDLTGPDDEFQSLANAFNALSKKVRDQIETLRSETEEKEAILESLGEGVIAVDGTLNVLYTNATATKMLNTGGEPLKTAAFDLLRRTQEEKETLFDSITLGEENPLFLDLITAPKTEETGAILVLQDRTTQHKMLEMGKDFVANASHELRTPITIIKGYAEALRDMPKMAPELFTEITEKIERNCTRMEELVKSLLLLADIENLPEARLIPTDLINILDHGKASLFALYPNAELTTHIPLDTLILDADPALLELAITNLLENAAKYSDAPARITLTLTQTDEEIQIEIADKGKGIPPHDLEHIFERFYRVDKTHSRRLGGAGLGLSIVKTIIAKHNGTITAESTVGEGTTFTIRLPLL